LAGLRFVWPTTFNHIAHRSNSIGGLWAELPAWQTLQNDTGDFCLNVRAMRLCFYWVCLNT
jgi:hypothetical protein